VSGPPRPDPGEGPRRAEDATRGPPYHGDVSAHLAAELRRMGIRDRRVLAAVEQVPREAFVPAELRRIADADAPLPIGSGQTISQPFIVAYMTAALQLSGGERVLEVGTGSGYQTAILARLAREVFTVEILPELAAAARERLVGLGYGAVHFRVGDGGLGWPEEAPFDRILVTAAAPEAPAALLEQLAPAGRLLLPVGPPRGEQRLELHRRTPAGGIEVEVLADVRFVPLRGAAGHAVV